MMMQSYYKYDFWLMGPYRKVRSTSADWSTCLYFKSHSIFFGAPGLMFIVGGYGHDDPVSNPGRGCYISYNADNLWKGLEPIILLWAMVKE